MHIVVAKHDAQVRHVNFVTPWLRRDKSCANSADEKLTAFIELELAIQLPTNASTSWRESSGGYPNFTTAAGDYALSGSHLGLGNKAAPETVLNNN